MKRLYFHIGFHKTGTTAIQTWCAENSSKLFQAGLFYPTVGRPSGKPYHRDFIGGENGAKWADLHAEVDASGLDSILISDEAWSAPWVQKQQIESLKDSLALYDVKIICVLRNPADYFVSRYRHQIRMGADTSHWTFQEFVKERVSGENEYLSQLDLWSSVFGKEAIDILIYDAVKHDGRLGSEFLARCGLGNLEKVSLPKSNVHWDDGRLKALRLAKRLERPVKEDVELSTWRSALATKVRSAGLGSPNVRRKLVRGIVGCFDFRPLVPIVKRRDLEELVLSWPRELVDAGYISEEQGRALGKE